MTYKSLIQTFPHVLLANTVFEPYNNKVFANLYTLFVNTNLKIKYRGPGKITIQ